MSDSSPGFFDFAGWSRYGADDRAERRVGNDGPWEAVRITDQFVIAFLGEDYPTKVWALVSDSIVEVCFGYQRFELDIEGGMARCRIDRPNRDHVYGVWR